MNLYLGDCRAVMSLLMDDDSVDAICTDPPYELGFMGKGWDASGIAYDPEVWRECLRVLKPGGHLLAFGGMRTQHRMITAIEDAGFEIRDAITWLYGQGFPKSLDVSKAIDKAAGAEREVVGRHVQSVQQRKLGTTLKGSEDGSLAWQHDITAPATPEAKQWAGWGTALKPASEIICVARKPLAAKTVAANVLEHGTGALNIDGCRVATTDKLGGGAENGGGLATKAEGWDRPWMTDEAAKAVHAATVRSNVVKAEALGRWPANVILDEEAAALLDAQTGTSTSGVQTKPIGNGGGIWSTAKGEAPMGPQYGDTGGASRFFYCAKAGKSERPVGPDGTRHATVKPLALMRWLVRLVTPPGGTVLDPFAGSGATLEAAILEGFDCIGIELTPEHIPLIQARLVRAHLDMLG